jgi:hypothetical protein
MVKKALPRLLTAENLHSYYINYYFLFAISCYARLLILFQSDKISVVGPARRRPLGYAGQAVAAGDLCGEALAKT